MRVMLTLLLACGMASAQGHGLAPNVVLIIIDTLRADTVFAERNGIKVMPNLQALAAKSWCYQNAQSEASWTKPSVVSILTSLYPGVHHVLYTAPPRAGGAGKSEGVDGIPDACETAMKFFQDHHYATAAVQTNRHLQARYGFAQGCDFYEDTDWAPATTVTDLAVGCARKMKTPFFLYAHYFDPHAPYEPPAEHRTAFGSVPEFCPEDEEWGEDEAPFGRYYADKIAFDTGRKARRDFDEISVDGRERFRALYDGECHYVDAQVQRLLDGLLAISPNTIIVIVGDHGEEFWDHASMGHVRTVYQEVVHVPLVIHAPRRPAREIPEPVQTIDILPTIAALAGLEARPAWEGVNLAPAVPRLGPVFSETLGTLPGAGIAKQSVTSDGFKLVRDHGKNVEVYDLKQDPKEQHNLFGLPDSPTDRLEELLEKHNREMAEKPEFQVPPSRTQLDAQTMEQLRALGYLAGDDEHGAPGHE